MKSIEDVDYIAVKLAQEQWDYKQERLTVAAAALIAIAFPNNDWLQTYQKYSKRGLGII